MTSVTRRTSVTYKLLILQTVCFAMIYAPSSIYPSIYWNPWNPLFACKDPSINVRIGDTINFLCPSDDYNFYIPSSHVDPIYENLYFLNEDEEKFKSCDATGAKRLLRCDDQQSTVKLHTISFRDIQTSEKSMKFKRGKTYYLIGTGFRETNKLDNLVNGSCRNSGGAGQFKLRLKLHICKDDNNCDICESPGCYYQKCGANCTKWGNYRSSVSNECNEIEKRVCRYPYLDKIDRIEYRPKTNFNKSECEENETNTNTNTNTNTGTAHKLLKTECHVDVYIIALSVIGLVVVLLCLYLLLRSQYIPTLVTKASTCILIGGRKHISETDKLSDEEMQISDGIERPKTEVLLIPDYETQEDWSNPIEIHKSVLKDFFKEIQANTNDDIERCKVENILELFNETQLDTNVETERYKRELIVNYFKDTLMNRNVETERSKTKLLIDLFRETPVTTNDKTERLLDIEPNIDDVDRARLGSRNYGFRNSQHNMPKKCSLEMI